MKFTSLFSNPRSFAWYAEAFLRRSACFTQFESSLSSMTFEEYCDEFYRLCLMSESVDGSRYSARDFICTAFPWGRSLQGFSFWSHISDLWRKQVTSLTNL